MRPVVLRMADLTQPFDRGHSLTYFIDT